MLYAGMAECIVKVEKNSTVISELRFQRVDLEENLENVRNLVEILIEGMWKQ